MAEKAKIIKFYGKHDLAIGVEAKEAFALLDGFDPAKGERTINEILSLYNCTKFVENNIWLKNFSEDEIRKYKSLSGEAKRVVTLYFQSIDKDNIYQKVREVDTNLSDDLVHLVVVHKLLDRIPKSVVLKALDMNGYGMHVILHSKNFVDKCEAEIREALLTNPRHLELITHAILYGTDQIHLPELSKQERDSILDKYLKSDRPNLNYVELIAKSSKNASDKTRLKAGKLHEKLVDELFAEDTNKIGYNLTIKIDPKQTAPLITRQNEGANGGFSMEVSFSRTYLDSLKTDEDVMFFFMNGFGLITEDSLLSLPAYPHGISALEKMVSNIGKDGYLDTNAFQMRLMSTLMSFRACVDYLEKQGHSLESALGWFFSDYLKMEFGAEGFLYRASTSSTYEEKAEHVLSKIDPIKRQFKCYVENGEIDPELMEVSSSTPSFRELPSLVPDKYLRANNKNVDVQRAAFLLCSDQSGLTFTESGKITAPNLLRLIIHNSVRYEDFTEYQQRDLDWLTEKGVLVKEASNIKVDLMSAAVLQDLYNYGAIVYPRYKNIENDLIEQWQEKSWLMSSSQLLTKEEADFFDFCLNNQTFSNNLGLRNKHIHGSEVYKSEDEHANDYIIALILMTSLAMKIYYDFKFWKMSS